MTKETKKDSTVKTENDIAENDNTESNSSESSTASNKSVFAPLGKYAVTGVIMVTLIVTTAIMLDKQLSTVEQEIASIEKEAAKNSDAAIANNSTEAQTAVTVAATPAETSITEPPAADVYVALATPKQTAQTTPNTVQSAPVQTTPVQSASVQNVEKRATAEPVKNTADTENNIASRQQQMAMESQARIETIKLEQKQRMAEMFSRIKTLEAQQLDRYKTGQDKQIENLRGQLAQKQQLIDRLTSRNKALYEMRAASIQRNQVKREEVLNRI